MVRDTAGYLEIPGNTTVGDCWPMLVVGGQVGWFDGSKWKVVWITVAPRVVPRRSDSRHLRGICHVGRSGAGGWCRVRSLRDPARSVRPSVWAAMPPRSRCYAGALQQLGVLGLPLLTLRYVPSSELELAFSSIFLPAGTLGCLPVETGQATCRSHNFLQVSPGVVIGPCGDMLPLRGCVASTQLRGYTLDQGHSVRASSRRGTQQLENGTGEDDQ
jgi:hypothetical protein